MAHYRGSRRSRRKLKTKSVGFKRRLRMQKRKSHKYNSFRIARGGIRL